VSCLKGCGVRLGVWVGWFGCGVVLVGLMGWVNVGFSIGFE